MKRQLLKISQIKINKENYIRNGVNYVTTMRYANALSTGAVFPPIAVNLKKWRYSLIDGLHRIEAYKARKEKYIEADIFDNLTEKEMYIEAIKRNSAHGLQFSAQETARIILKLKKYGIKRAEISKLVRIPVKNLERFVEKRLVRVIGSRGGYKGTDVVKTELKHLAGGSYEELDQDKLMGLSQVNLIDELIDLLKRELIDFENKAVVGKLKRLYKLLSATFS